MKTKLGIGILLLAATLAGAQTTNLTSLLQKGLFEEQASRDLDAAIVSYQTLAAQFDKDRQLAATAVFRLGECYRAQGKTNEAAAQYQRILKDFSDQQTLATLSRQNLAGMGASEANPGFVQRLQKIQNKESENPDAVLLKKLKDLPLPQLEKVLPTVMPDATLSDLLQKRDAALAERNQLVVDYAPENTLVTRKDALLKELNRQIAEKITGMLAGLEMRSQLPLAAAGDARQQQKDLLNKQIALAEQDVLDKQKLLQIGRASQTDARAAEREVLRLRQQLAALDSNRPELYRAELPGLSAPADSEEDKAIARIKEMIKNSPDLINGNPIQGSPLGRAAEAGQLRVATFLLENGADVNAPHFTAGKTALIVAANAGQKTMVELLLQHGAKINASDSQNQTALHLAVEQGFLGVTEALLNAKADPNLLNADIQTPLLIAAKKGSVPLAALLLAHGADPNIARKVRPGYGTNPVEEGRKMFGTPLHIAAARGDAEMVALLLTNRADVKALSVYEETPLQVAAACGKADVAELLLATGANPDARSDANSGTPLHLAVWGGHSDVAGKLLSHGANPDATARINCDGVTPLMLAASGGNDDIARLLLQHKANPNLKDEKGNCALTRAIEAKQAAVAKTLLAHGADPNVKNADGWSALMLAAGRNNPEIVAALIAAKADVNWMAANQMTALHFAAADGRTDIVKLLLNAKVNVNARDVNGETPLHFAVRRSKYDIVALLLDAKADPNARNNYGITPLDLVKEIRASGSLPGGTLTIDSGGTLALPGSAQPLTYQWHNGEPAPSNAPVSIADLLRQHGALDELPDFTRIRITRQGLKQPVEVFQAGANLTNQFTLLETVMRFYNRSSFYIPGQGTRNAWDGLPFPDFGRIIIRRPSPKIGGKETEIKVSLLNRSNQVDCTLDVPVQFGDVIEIPESVHALNAAVPNPVQEMENGQSDSRQLIGVPAGSTFAERLQAITKANASPYRTAAPCLEKNVKLVVAGETTTFKVNSWREGFLSQALGKTEARSALRSSSDLSRVKVIRQTGHASKPAVFIVDASGNGPTGVDLWLQDGDVIEVPEKK